MGKFKELAIEIQESKPVKMLSIGNNQKLNKAIAIYNLPAQKTCIGRTPYCTKVCYAVKAERIYKGARDMRERNYQASLLPSFVDNIKAEIKSIKGLNMIRHCESGDWTTQKDVDNWFEIANAFPSIRFLAYTKSFTLDFSKKPDNFEILFSVDATTTLPIPKYSWTRLAYTVAKGEAIPTQYYDTCNQNTASGKIDKHYCGTSCFKCWNGSFSHIYFNQH